MWPRGIWSEGSTGWCTRPSLVRLCGWLLGLRHVFGNDEGPPRWLLVSWAAHGCLRPDWPECWCPGSQRRTPEGSKAIADGFLRRDFEPQELRRALLVKLSRFL